MTVPTPNLDDRTFAQLVDEARRRIAGSCPQWSDLSAHDPGITLVEAFAFLTETMIYRLNRLPDKAFVEFLNILGVQRQPPVAASVELLITRRQADGVVTVPAGTRVTISGGSGKDAPVFATATSVTLAADVDQIVVPATHGEAVEGERLGRSDGSPGQAFSVSRPPIVRTSEVIDVMIGIETDQSQLPDGAAAREWDGRTFWIWEPTATFALHEQDAPRYVLERAEGRILFAPAVDMADPGSTTSVPAPASGTGALAAIPLAGAEVRAWYRTGGGPAGNVAAGSLTVWKDPVPGLDVTNPEPARGGRAMETLDNVLQRGPNEFLTTRRAVTASDFELLAVHSSGDVSRAKALTRSEVWSFARPGEVEVVLVPHVPDDAAVDGRFSLEVLEAHQTDQSRRATEAQLDEARALGTRCIVEFAQYKEVSVRARVIVRREEDETRVRRRILERLNTTLSPLPSDVSDGWRFGRALRRSNVYRLLESAEPGVQWVEDVHFVVTRAPDATVTAVAADRYQPHTWYAGAADTLFRSINDARGWEPVHSFDGERVDVVMPYPQDARPGIAKRPGLVAVATRAQDGTSSSIYVSQDLGSNWQKVAGLDTRIGGLAWTNRGPAPELLIAADTGLYELALVPNGTPNQVLVEPSDHVLGFYDVVAFTNERGEWSVAVAAQAEQGVYLSTDAGRPGSFHMVGLRNQYTGTLCTQFDGSGAWLWVGLGETSAAAAQPGATRARLFEADIRWEPRQQGWVGGTCTALACAGRRMFASTHSAGVLSLDLDDAALTWRPLDVNAGLPMRDLSRFEPVDALAAAPDGTVLLSGGSRGVHRSDAAGVRWEACDHRRDDEVVTIPPTWLICSGVHEVEVVSGRGTRRD